MAKTKQLKQPRVRVIVDCRCARKDVTMRADLATQMYHEGKLVYDVTNRTFALRMANVYPAGFIDNVSRG